MPNQTCARKYCCPTPCTQARLLHVRVPKGVVVGPLERRTTFGAQPMIVRYTPPDFAKLWSPARRYGAWLEVELAACEAMERAGLVPSGTAGKLRAQKIVLDPERIDAIERTVKHDVIAFLTHVEEKGGADARWLHRGMTSSDVLDTSLALLMRDAADLLLARCGLLLAALAKRARHR